MKLLLEKRLDNLVQVKLKPQSINVEDIFYKSDANKPQKLSD